MAGSTSRAGRAHDAQCRQRQRDAVADGERRDDQPQPGQRAAQEDQADDEQDVVGTDGDVVDAGRHERRQHRADAGPGAGVVVHRRPPRVEDRLMTQGAVLVDVDERLVLRIVGEERGVDAQPAWAAGRRLAGASANAKRTAWRSGSDVMSESAIATGRPSTTQRSRRLSRSRERRAVACRRRGIEQCGRVRQAELVRGVEVVDGERCRRRGRRRAAGPGS